MNNPVKENKWLNVFLVDSITLPRPMGYAREFFDKLFFSVSEPLQSPDGGKIQGSVYDYFFNVSDGYIRAKGKVNEWVTLDEDLTNVPHWVNGSQAAASEAIIAVAVAGCLKKNRIKTREDLNINGNATDGLAFVVVDYLGGGAQRQLNGDHRRSVKSQLTALGRTDLWDPAWDSWNIDFIMVPCTTAPGVQLNSDGTTDDTILSTDLQWFSSDVLLHECGHLLLHLPDLYLASYGPWAQMDLMGNSRSEKNPAKLSSYSQIRSGWFNSEKFPFRTHRSIVQYPLETHSQAFEFQNGIGILPETVIVENRHRWDYWGNNDHTQNKGNALYIYRNDSNSPARQIVPDGDQAPIRRITTPIKRSGNWGEVWGAGVNDLVETGPSLGNSLNYLGEDWWNFTNIKVLSNDAIEYDAVFKGIDLIASYNEAEWKNGHNDVLTPNKFMGEAGHVMYVNRSLPIENGERFDGVLSLHPNWVKNEKIEGKWTIEIPNTKSARLYLEVALSEEAIGSDGVRFSVKRHNTNSVKTVTAAKLDLKRNHRIIAVDLNEIDSEKVTISIEVDSGSTSTRDWVYLLKAFLVRTSPILYDFIKMSPAAKWTGLQGDIPFISARRSPKNKGEVSIKQYSRLQNGTIYGGGNLFTHPSWDNEGFIRGSYSITLPNGNSVFRAELGFLENRKVTSNGVKIKVYFIPLVKNSFRRTPPIPLMEKALLNRETASGEIGLEDNPVTGIAIPIPMSIQGVTGEFVIEVHADGSSGQDWVLWTMMKLTSD